jgi:hypothetical protein
MLDLTGGCHLSGWSPSCASRLLLSTAGFTTQHTAHPHAAGAGWTGLGQESHGHQLTASGHMLRQFWGCCTDFRRPIGGNEGTDTDSAAEILSWSRKRGSVQVLPQCPEEACDTNARVRMSSDRLRLGCGLCTEGNSPRQAERTRSTRSADGPICDQHSGLTGDMRAVVRLVDTSQYHMQGAARSVAPVACREGWVVAQTVACPECAHVFSVPCSDLSKWSTQGRVSSGRGRFLEGLGISKSMPHVDESQAQSKPGGLDTLHSCSSNVMAANGASPTKDLFTSLMKVENVLHPVVLQPEDLSLPERISKAGRSASDAGFDSYEPNILLRMGKSISVAVREKNVRQSMFSEQLSRHATDRSAIAFSAAQYMMLPPWKSSSDAPH